MTLDLSNAARVFSDAAIGAINWQSSLDEICQFLGASGATIVPLKGKLSTLPTSSGFKEAIDAYLQQEWHQQDVRFRALPTLRKNGFATDLDFTSEAEMARSPYYQDWLRPFGFKWFSAVHIAGIDEEWVLSLQRSETQGPFDRSECQQFISLSQSLSASANLANALGFSRADAAMEAFDLSRKAVLMLNQHGEVVRINQAADNLLGEDVFVRSRRICCSDLNSARTLDEAIWRAGSLLLSHLESSVTIARGNAGPLLASVVAARGAALDIFSSVRVYVILNDPFKRTTASKQALQALFGLTNAQSELALRLSSGAKLRDVAEATGVSYETVRSHLQEIFVKTNVNSQADLTALLLQTGQ